MSFSQTMFLALHRDGYDPRQMKRVDAHYDLCQRINEIFTELPIGADAFAYCFKGKIRYRDLEITSGDFFLTLGTVGYPKDETGMMNLRALAATTEIKLNFFQLTEKKPYCIPTKGYSPWFTLNTWTLKNLEETTYFYPQDNEVYKVPRTRR